MKSITIVADDVDTLEGTRPHCINCGPVPDSVKVIEESRGQNYYALGAHHRCAKCAAAFIAAKFS